MYKALPVVFNSPFPCLPTMACKEDLDRLLQDEDKYSELHYSPAQRDQSQLLFYKRYAFIASLLLTLSIILNAILFSSRATQFTIMSDHDRSEYGSLLNCFYHQMAF